MGAFADALNQQFDPLYGLNPQQSAIGDGITTGLTQMQNPLTMSWNQLGIGGKLGVVSQGLGAFSNLASLYAGFKALQLQKDQFRFQKDAWNKNYNNQLKDYENTLKDRWTARNAWAQNNNRSYDSMSSWVGSRMPNGQAPTGNYSQAAPNSGGGSG
jgi:hypothetical protein